MFIWLSAAQCDFESDSCGWYELIQGDGFEWVRGSADGVSTEYLDQTPPRDHSTNTSAGESTHINTHEMPLSHSRKRC